jgi:pilus assembly protein TadC
MVNSILIGNQIVGVRCSTDLEGIKNLSFILWSSPVRFKSKEEQLELSTERKRLEEDAIWQFKSLRIHVGLLLIPELIVLVLRVFFLFLMNPWSKFNLPIFAFLEFTVLNFHLELSESLMQVWWLVIANGVLFLKDWEYWWGPFEMLTGYDDQSMRVLMATIFVYPLLVYLSLKNRVEPSYERI